MGLGQDPSKGVEIPEGVARDPWEGRLKIPDRAAQDPWKGWLKVPERGGPWVS